MTSLTSRLRSWGVAACLLAVLTGVSESRAANRWWDGGTVDIVANGDGASGGTAGTWNTTTLNWDQGNGLAHVAWVNGNNDAAIFAGTAGTVTLGEDISAGSLMVSGGYAITGAQTLTLNDTGTGLGFSSSGILTLGATTTLRLGASQTWRPASNTMYSYGIVTCTVTGGGVFLNGNNLTIERYIPGYTDNSGALAVKSLISGTGNLTIVGKYAIYNDVGVQLGSANTYIGVTTISKYILLNGALANGGSPSCFGQSSNVPENLVFNGGGIYYSGGNSGTDRGITLIGSDNALAVVSGTTWTLSGRITGSGGVALRYGNNSYGTLVLAGSNDFSGTLSFVSGGSSLRLTHASALSMATLDTTAGNIDLTTTNLAYVVGALAGTGNLNLGTGLGGGGSGFVSVGNNNRDTTYSGVLSGAAGLAKIGSGTQTLRGLNLHTGTTMVSSGMLVLAVSGVLSSNSTVKVNGGTLSLAANNAGGTNNAVFLNGGVLDPGVKTNAWGGLTVGGDSVLRLATGCSLSFADSSSLVWSNAMLTVAGDFPERAVRFGATAAGLTREQLLKMRSDDRRVILDEEGFLAILKSGTCIMIE